MKLLTNLIFEPKGKHDPALAYIIKDTVMSADGSKVYFAVQDVPANTPLTDEDYWKLQIDLSGSKHALDEAAAAFADQVKFVGTRVKGETAKVTGNPVSFLPDAGSLLQPVTVLEPQQEGSGDPYPAGGGKNLLNNTATTQVVNGVTFTVNADETVTVDGTATANAVFRITCNLSVGETYTLSGCPAGGSTSTYFMQIGNFGNDTGSGVTAAATENTGSSVALLVMSGYTASNIVFKPQLELGSTATEFQPYSNIRPFIGYDKLDLNRAGRNLLPNTATTQTINGVTFTMNEDGSVQISGTATDFTTIQISSSESFNLPNGDYILSGCPDGGSEDVPYALAFWNTDGADAFAFNKRGDTPFTFTNEDGNYNLSLWINAGETYNSLIFKPMIRFASDTDPTFQPYTNKLHTVQIGQTVYGIRYEWLTGKGAIEWAMYTVTVGDFAKNGANQFVMTHNLSAQAFAECACSHFIGSKRGAYDSAVNNSATVSGTGLWFYSKAFETAEEFNAFINAQNAAGTPVQLVYKLATPIEIQLTPHIISAVEPEQNNTLYGDGTIEVEYVKPLHVSIEERVAAALAAATE